MNIWYENGRQFCNSKCLVKPELPFWASCFIDEIRKEPSLRTGLDFPTKGDIYNLTSQAFSDKTKII